MPIIKKSLSVKLRNANFFLKLSAKARNFTPPLHSLEETDLRFFAVQA